MGKPDEDRTAITVAIAVGIGLTLRWRLGWPVTHPVLVLIAYISRCRTARCM